MFDKSCQIREEFIQYLKCKSGTFGKELYWKIVNVIRDFGLEIGNLRGQGYDGLVIWQEKKKWCIIQNLETE